MVDISSIVISHNADVWQRPFTDRYCP